MQIQDSIKLKELYANGFYQSNLPTEVAQEVLNHIQTKETWVEDVEASAIILNASWDNGKSVESKSIPDYYEKFLTTFLASGFLKNYEDLYGKFTAYGAALHKSPKGYVNGWHGHFMDGFHLHLLFHLTPHQRVEEDGGLIEFGLVLDSEEFNVNFETYNQIEPRNVFRTGSFVSHQGQFEVLLNSHPMYRHQVTEVVTNQDRYTLMFFLGYKDNILNSKKHINNL